MNIEKNGYRNFELGNWIVYFVISAVISDSGYLIWSILEKLMNVRGARMMSENTSLDGMFDLSMEGG